MRQRLQRFRDGRGEYFEVTSKGAVVTWRVAPFGVYLANTKARVDVLDSAEDAEQRVAQLLAEHRSLGFVELSTAELASQLALIQPYARWKALDVASLPEYFAYLDAGELLAAFAASVRTIDPVDWRITLASGAELTFALPLESVANEPAPVRPYWERHAVIWAERDGFEITLGRDMGPPEEDGELEGTGFTAVQWVMSRGTEQFWFYAHDGTLRLYDMDGGVRDPVTMPLGRLWLEKILAL